MAWKSYKKYPKHKGHTISRTTLEEENGRINMMASHQAGHGLAMGGQAQFIKQRCLVQGGAPVR